MFNDTWKDLSEIVIYGLGMVGKKYFDLLRREFVIKCIVDNNPNALDFYRGVRVISLVELLKIRRNEKIIVLASKEAFLSIKRDLEQYKLVEYEDYVGFESFVSDWYWQVKNKNCIREVHMATNTDCTFRCEKCNMFVPYYKDSTIYTLEDIRKSLDIFFPLVDFVFVFSYLGGEPFLNRELKDILRYTYENYYTKIGRIEVVSNGSLIPDAMTLEAMRRYHVLVRISDYTEHISYQKKLQKVIDILEKYEIAYSVEKSLEWVDFCFPGQDGKGQLPIKDVRSHMLCCSPAFHGLNDEKFYYCHVAWSAEKAGLTVLKDSDYIELKNVGMDMEGKRHLVEYARGVMKESYVSLCAKCMGCGIDNHFVIPAGQQAERKKYE